MSGRHSVYILLILAFVLMSANVGGYSIYIVDEARNAQCAWEMLESGDLVVPTFNRELRADKPPLHYYHMMLGYLIFGKGPLGARFFSVIYGVLTILIVFLATRRHLGSRVATIASLILLSSVGFIIQFHLATPDPYLIFFVLAALMFFFDFDQDQRPRDLYLAYLFIGMGVLAKGPIAILLPGLVVVCYGLFKRKINLSYIRKLRPLHGIFIVLLITLPWYVWVHVKTDGVWTYNFFFRHNVDRFLQPRESHGGVFFLPLIFAMVMTLPYSVFLPQTILRAWKEKNDFLQFSMISMLCVIVFFSFSGTKLPNYVAPALPFLAILVASGLTAADLKGKRISLLLVMVFSVLTIPVVRYLTKVTAGLGELSGIHWFFLPLAIASVIGLIMSLLGRKFAPLIILGIGFIIFHQLFFYYVYPKVDALNPVRKTAGIVQNAPVLVYYKRMNQAYPFLIGKKISRYTSAEDLSAAVLENEAIVVITRSRYLDEIAHLPLTPVEEAVDIFDNTTTVVLLKN